ncbi:hypothetical protein A3C57_02615 [Candidatus Nomurabacteria bacterium RIFCSPHIGHO2_02_FULL_33_12]|uniref:DoxX family protein n=1 Tax=Candidatus Nomurabacteria bacterium RIFCSPLOWO2_01_FULL_33_17 TaxID=1801764 RepID=A0A1F6WPK4_9BACT|nr:MAG: hypothetical protein A3C57_02615 [Candidatus Nomurabacteria bacterium RIFCSPHIGHO2_02_FULL_33_12]OGI83821.1 MAG: hypothetical protein A2903_00200 [Candidatus Nomurabacteria bacterium RIFCSPLOWO2_01_FULL_33_17]
MCNKNISCFTGSGCRCTKDAGLLFLRIAVGVPFIVHGLAKFMDIPGTTGFFASLGLSPIFTYLVSGGELLAGIMILLGVWSFLGGWIASIIMVCAYTLVKYKAPFLGGYELDFAFFFGGLAIAMLGSGRYSLIRGHKCNSECIPGTCNDKKELPNVIKPEDNQKKDLMCECDGKGGCSDGVCTTCPGCNPDLNK